MYKILLIERNIDLLQILEEWLALFGFIPIAAATLAQGYQLATSEQPDLILCGYGFPEFHGLELLHTLQAHSTTANIPFLLMTGANLEDIPNWQTHLHKGQLLFKPFEIDCFVKTLRSKLPVFQPH